MNQRRTLSAVSIFLSAACLLPLSSTAQSSSSILEAARALEGTAYVLPMNQSSAGEVQGCGFEFKAVTFDNAYKRGAPVIINGSFAVSKMNSQLVAFTYKLGTFNMSDDGLKPEAPHYAWIKFGNTLLKPEKSTAGESVGYKLYLSQFSTGADVILDTVIAQREVVIGFNRKEGGLDVVTKLDLDVRDTKVGAEVVRVRDKQLGVGFERCIGDLFASLKLPKQ